MERFEGGMRAGMTSPKGRHKMRSEKRAELAGPPEGNWVFSLFGGSIGRER